MSLSDTEVQDQITAFWTVVAPHYDLYPGNVPDAESSEHEAWILAIATLMRR